MALKKRSISIAGHATSITLEPEFWQALEQITVREKITLPQLVKQIDSTREPKTNLSSAIRVYILSHLKN